MASLRSFAFICGPEFPSMSWSELVYYLAWSTFSNESYKFDSETCYSLFINRTPYEEARKKLNIHPKENTVFQVRFDLLNTNNEAYQLAVKGNPTVEDLERFASLRPCWSTLFPVKMYLSDHPDLAKRYRGLLPFGREVIAFYNDIMGPEYRISTQSPSLYDHICLAEYSAKLADLLGMTTVAVNHIMYIEGKRILKRSQQDMDQAQDTEQVWVDETGAPID